MICAMPQDSAVMASVFVVRPGRPYGLACLAP
jgi:hypothetical protein